MSERTERECTLTDHALNDQREAGARARRDPRMDRLAELRAQGIPRDRAIEMVDREWLGEDSK